MNFETLQELYNKEKELAGLQQVPHDFYDQAGQLVKELQKNMRYSAGMDEMFKVEDMLRNARMMIEAIIEIRKRKVLEAAALDLQDLRTARANFAGQEELLYNKLHDVLADYKKFLPEL